MRLPGDLRMRGRLSDAKFGRLLKLITRYPRESERCADAKAYYGACVLVGAALEGALLAMCCVYPEDAEQAKSTLPSDRRPSGRCVRWTLDQLLAIAWTAGWLPVRRGARGPRKVGDWAELVQALRNLVHAGRHLRSYPKVRLGSGHFADARTIFHAVNDHLYSKLTHDILKALGARKKGGRPL